jgi:hypothetical protein
VLNFGSFASRDADFFTRFPKLVWGYLPSLEEQARVFSGYVCTKVAGKPVQSGGAAHRGQKRVYGLWSTSDPGRPELQALAEEVERRVADCGVTLAAKRTFPSAGFVQDNRYSPRYASEAVAEFEAKGVTTVIWPGGLETNLTKQSASAGYQPEFILLGDGVIETENSGKFQDRTVFDGAKVVTPQVLIANIRTAQCYLAYKEVSPDAYDLEVQTDACAMYANLRQLFTGIQVAGPRLGPTSVDAGFHAIPAIRSPRPDVPACFYNRDDYTCVKDAIVEHWDRDGNTDGCFRVTEGGRRYFAEVWPAGNINDQERSDDPCNEYDGTFVVNPAPPDDPTTF